MKEVTSGAKTIGTGNINADMTMTFEATARRCIE